MLNWRWLRCLGVLALSMILAACSGAGKHQDLKDYIAETKRRPAGQIDPLPPFVPYKSFAYSAMAKRSPFDPPSEEIANLVVGKKSNIKPDLSREKELLESFNLGSLKMVGTLKRDDTLWALIDDNEGGIHRVTTGNYMGANHGRIVATSSRQVDVIEIVPNGADGWVERPKVLPIAEKE